MSSSLALPDQVLLDFVHRLCGARFLLRTLPTVCANTLLQKASGVVPGVGARARPSQEENELELLKCAKIAG